MKATWPKVRLGEVLSQTTEPHRVQADEQYPNFGIYSFGRGLFHKPPISGSTTSANTLYRVKKGHFIYSRLFAFEGAYGLVTDPFHGHYVSNEYPVFEPNLSRILPEYLAAHFRWPPAWEEVAEKSVGMGDRRRRVQPAQFLTYEIPLPPLAEQRRVVARIEELAAQIHEARALRQQAAEKGEALIASSRRSLFGERPDRDWVPLSRFVHEIENGKSPQCEARPATDEEWGVLKVGAVSFGTFDERQNKALPVGLKFDARYEVRSGDFLMTRANTTDLVGACAIVGRTRPRLLLSDKTFRFHFRADVEVHPTWLDHSMKSPVLREQIARGASGTSPTMKNISKDKVLGLLLPEVDPKRWAHYGSV